jgi:hypothetical protein
MKVESFAMIKQDVRHRNYSIRFGGSACGSWGCFETAT